MNITAPAVYEHEIAKHSDFQAGFESIIRNTAVLDRMLVSAESDYIVGGEVAPVAGSLAVCIGKIWGNGLSLDLPLFNAGVSEDVPLTPPVSEDRIDTLQARAVFEEYDEQRRAFFNPETESGQYFSTPTKKRLKIEWAILPGGEGREAAPEADSGWLKLAEILVSPGMAEVPAENIRNVTALYQGEENAAWTNQRTRTFCLGSALELKTMFALEHTVSGGHREKVIHAANVDFGTGGNQVSAKKIPLGEAYTIGDDTFNALDSIFEALVKETGYRRSNGAALTLAIRIINETIADMVHEAPDDGAIYGRKNNAWVEVTDGAGGEGGDAIEALRFYSKKTLMLTNAGIVKRRKRGWDIGLAYLSPLSKVYHFDTDLNDQNQETNIEIEDAGEAPALVGVDDTNGHIYFNPAVLAVPPYEMKGRSLYGKFSLKTRPSTPTETFTAEAWIRLIDGSDGSLVMCMENGMESIALYAGTKEFVETEYSAVVEEDGIYYGAAEYDGIMYSKAKIITGNYVMHEYSDIREIINLGDAGIMIHKKTWIHIATVSTPEVIALYIGNKKIEFEKKIKQKKAAFCLTLNPAKDAFNIDELLLDEAAAVQFESFKENSAARVPYAALDYKEEWFVLEADDVSKVKTNLFETDVFKNAVKAALT